MNRIKVDETWHPVDQDYRMGALAQRWDLKSLNSDPFPDTPSFHAGVAHEHACLHLRFGVDVVTASDEDRDFDVDPDHCYFVDRFRRPRIREYREALMDITGYLRIAKQITEMNRELPPSLQGNSNTSRVDRLREEEAFDSLITPGVLKRKMMGMGYPVSTEFCSLMLTRMRHERYLKNAPEPLTEDEEAALATLRDNRRDLIIATGRAQFEPWWESTTSDKVAWHAGRKDSWVSGLTLTMLRNEEVASQYIAHSRNGYISLTPKGLTAFAHLAPDLAEGYGLTVPVSIPADHIVMQLSR